MLPGCGAMQKSWIALEAKAASICETLALMYKFTWNHVTGDGNLHQNGFDHKPRYVFGTQQ